MLDCEGNTGLTDSIASTIDEFKADVLTKDVRTTRHLNPDNLRKYYTDDEVSDITKDTSGEYTALSDVKYQDELTNQKRKPHVWTLAEDEFIRKNYKHLSDNTIGLALNIPGRMVKFRRQRLQLFKGQVKELNKIIVWCNRTDFDTVCQEQLLTKSRG